MNKIDMLELTKDYKGFIPIDTHYLGITFIAAAVALLFIVLIITMRNRKPESRYSRIMSITGGSVIIISLLLSSAALILAVNIGSSAAVAEVIGSEDGGAVIEHDGKNYLLKTPGAEQLRKGNKILIVSDVIYDGGVREKKDKKPIGNMDTKHSILKRMNDNEYILRLEDIPL